MVRERGVITLEESGDSFQQLFGASQTQADIDSILVPLAIKAHNLCELEASMRPGVRGFEARASSEELENARMLHAVSFEKVTKEMEQALTTYRQAAKLARGAGFAVEAKMASYATSQKYAQFRAASADERPTDTRYEG